MFSLPRCESRGCGVCLLARHFFFQYCSVTCTCSILLRVLVVSFPAFLPLLDSPDDIKRLTDIFNKMFADSQSKVFFSNPDFLISYFLIFFACWNSEQVLTCYRQLRTICVWEFYSRRIQSMKFVCRFKMFLTGDSHIIDYPLSFLLVAFSSKF